jgi:hypothetical protein
MVRDASQTLDAFISRAPVGERVDLLVVPQASPWVQNCLAQRSRSNRINIITNNESLEYQCNTIENQLKYLKYRKIFIECLSSVFSMEYAPEGLPGSFRWSLFNWMGASRANYDPVYLIYRDKIEALTLSRFLNVFTRVPPDARPKIVVDTQGDAPSTKTILAASVDSARFFVPSEMGIIELFLSPTQCPRDRFVEFFAARALSLCASAAISEPEDDATIHDQRLYVIRLYQRIQAKKGCYQKFNAANDIMVLESHLRKLLIYFPENDARWFAEALIFVLLDKAYVFEEKNTPVDEASTLAKFLCDEELSALVARFINFSAGVTPFASYQLEKSASELQKQERYVEALYSRTNQVITDLHRVGGIVDDGPSRAMVDFALDWTPYCDRLSSVLNAAGVTSLLANKTVQAASYFTEASRANGNRLHQLSAEINLLITHHIAGDKPDYDRIERIFRAIAAAKLSKQLNYHRTYLYGNLLILSRKKSLKSKISNVLKKMRLLDYSNEIIDDEKIFDFLATKFRIISDGERFRGHRGAFVERYNLLPLCQFIWS